MSAQTKKARQLDKIDRAERLLATIAALEKQIESISASGEVAPQGCHLARQPCADDPAHLQQNRHRRE